MNLATIEWTGHLREAPMPLLSRASVEPATPTVFIVDENPSVRRSLVLLADHAGWHAETFASASDFLACPRVLAPSCLVLDAGLSDVTGLDMQQRLIDRPETPIIFISDRGDVHTAVRAMKAGALEFLTKPLVEEQLLTALRCGIQRSGAVIARLAELDALQVRHRSLSGREHEVMTLVVRGLLNKQVAAELGISEITVKAHRGRMMRKMNARSVPDLVRMAAKLFPAS